MDKAYPVRLGLTAGRPHNGLAAHSLLGRLSSRPIILGDNTYDADVIRTLIARHGAFHNILAKSNSN